MIEIEAIAKIAHETNRAYCEALGDTSNLPWEQAPDWQKESAIKGIQLHLDSDCIMGAEESHYAWMEHKLREGWTYGPVKDAEKKQHPGLLPFNSLPTEEKVKDYLFGNIARIFRDWKQYEERKAQQVKQNLCGTSVVS